jgi:hypothetical protein
MAVVSSPVSTLGRRQFMGPACPSLPSNAGSALTSDSIGLDWGSASPYISLVDMSTVVRAGRPRLGTEFPEFGRFAEPSLLLVSLSDGPKHGHAIRGDDRLTAVGASMLVGQLRGLSAFARQGLMQLAGTPGVAGGAR